MDFNDGEDVGVVWASTSFMSLSKLFLWKLMECMRSYATEIVLQFYDILWEEVWSASKSVWQMIFDTLEVKGLDLSKTKHIVL